MICDPGYGMEKAQLSRSKAIDKALAKDKQVLKSQVQLLLLGRPRAGKTTLVKQLRVKNGDTFSAEEKEASKMTLLENLTDAIRSLLCTREELVLPWNNEVTEEDALVLTCRPLTRLLSERGWKGVMSMLIRLWQEEGVRKAWEQCCGSGVTGMECLPKFLDDPLRLCDQMYSPSTSDMMHIYRTTRGVSDCAVKGEAAFRLVEMGGRSLTTPKLLHFFDNVNAVIFVASCCDVERKIRHGAFTSGFQETCEFFALVSKDKSLMKLPIILLITKLDILMEKSKRLDLKTMLPEFKGNSQELKDVQKYLVEVFRSKCGTRPFYHHFMNCTDLGSVQEVFVEIKRDIRDSLLRKLLPQ